MGESFHLARDAIPVPKDDDVGLCGIGPGGPQRCHGQHEREPGDPFGNRARVGGSHGAER